MIYRDQRDCACLLKDKDASKEMRVEHGSRVGFPWREDEKLTEMEEKVMGRLEFNKKEIQSLSIIWHWIESAIQTLLMKAYWISSTILNDLRLC